MAVHAEFWIVIAAAGAGTLLMRTLPFLAHGVVDTPESVQRVLRYVPAASLASLVVPGSILVNQAGIYEVHAPRVIALAFAVLVALRWRSVPVTLVAGMIVLWVLQAVL